MYDSQTQWAVAFPVLHKSVVQKLHSADNWLLFIVKSHFCLFESCFIVFILQVLTDIRRSSCLVLSACGFDQLDLISLCWKLNEKHYPPGPVKKPLNRLSARATPRHKQLKTVIFQSRAPVLIFDGEHVLFESKGQEINKTISCRAALSSAF